MDKNFIDSLYSSLAKQLKNLRSTAQAYPDRLALIADSLAKLKIHILENGFSSEEQEIEFFKHIKPRFYLLYIYEVEFYNLISNVPVGTDDMIKDYYLSELSFIKRFFKQHSFLYEYFSRDEVALDNVYFLRSTLELFIPEVAVKSAFGVLDDFSTNQDYNFSKFMALEKLQEYIIERIRLIFVKPEVVFSEEDIKQHKKLRWTDEKIKLVELAYGIYLSGSINNGKTEIADVVLWLEKSLNIDLGVPYRKFISIGRRKNISYTKYVDAMKVKIEAYIAKKNSYLPKGFRSD